VLTPNALRKRIEYVAKQFPAVLYETAYVTAHTVGADRDAIEKDRKNGVDFTVRFSADAHQSEAMVPWVAKELNAAMREVRKGRLGEREFVDLVNLLEAKMPNIATWAEATKPDLTKLTVAEAITAAAKFEPDDAAPVPQGEVIYRFADGWTVQELTEPEQIFAEGEAVQNCLRKSQYGPEYFRRSQDGEIRIFSLRTPAGSPRVSMEFEIDEDREIGGRFEQIFAKQNTSLNATLKEVLEEGGDEALWRGIQRYKPRIGEFITEELAADPDGLILAGAPLPAGLTNVGGDLDLYGYTLPLPAGLTNVGGDLDLGGYTLPLPAGLTSVEGDLVLGGYTLPLPAGLTSVGGDLYLRGYTLPLPAGLTSVGRSLYLRGYTLPLPAGLTNVGGSLDLKGYPLPLPAGMKVQGRVR